MTLIYPLHNDYEIRRMSTLLKRFFIVACFAWILVVLLIRGWDIYVAAGVGITSAIGCLWLIQRQHFLVPRLVPSLVFLGSATFFALVGNGIHDLSLSLFMVAIVAAGYFLSPSGGILVAILCLSLYALIFGLERADVIVGSGVDPGSAEFIDFTLMLSTCAALITAITWVNRRDIDNANENARRVDEADEETQRAKAALSEETRALSNSEEKYRFLAENATDVIWVTDLEAKVTYVSPSIKAFSGYTVEEDKARTIEERLTADSAKATREALRTELELENSGNRDPDRVVSLDVKYKHKDGRVVWGEFTARLLRDADGLPIGILGATRNIDERKNTENELRVRESQLAEAQRISHTGNWVWNIETNQLDWSDEIYRIFGNTPQSFNSTYDAFLDAVHPDDVEYVQASVDAALNDVEPYDIEHRIVRADGSEGYVHERAEVLRNEEGLPIVMQGIVQDITAREEARERERELEALKNQAQKLESLGVLAGGIAHDFNNLLMAIQGNVDIARSTLPPDKEAHEALSVAFEACDHATDLSSRLLTFAKGGDPIRETVAMQSTIRASVRLALSGTNISADIQIAENLWAANVDVSQIRQVFSNLTINATHAMPEGGKFWIKAQNTTLNGQSGLGLPEGRYVNISFRDEGVGIEPENLGRVFDPFFSTKDQGSGLGLAASYSTVNRHGGLITVESERGVGSTFQLYLPASGDDVMTVPNPAPLSIKGNGRILAMEDDPLIQKLTVTFLERLGYDVDLAVDGDEAVARFAAAQTAQQPYDGVVLDLTIRGGMGGEEAVKRMRKLNPDVKAIVASGHSDQPVMANYRDFGFSGVLTKPYTVGQLSSVLDQVLGGS